MAGDDDDREVQGCLLAIIVGLIIWAALIAGGAGLMR